jgi:CBS domain-containing protein
MQVKHILFEKGREVVTIGSDATLSEAARLMARRRIGAVVVRGLDGAIAGILCERDIVCCEHDTIEDLMESMTRGRFRHVPVIEDDHLVGIISIGDVVKTRIQETIREAESLRDYIAAR